MIRVILEAWDRALCLKDPRIISADHIPKPLQGYAHWTQKVGGCIFSFSRQNMWRIKNAYNEEIQRGECSIDVKGKYRIDNFAAKVSGFKKMEQLAEAIKNGQRLDDGYEYKSPPLGVYQDVASQLLASVDRVPLFADCGLGKSWAVLTAAERRMMMLALTPGKLLICGKLMTLETSWMADCYRFTNLRPVMLWLKPTKNRKEKLIDLLNSPGDVFITNHETVRILEDALTMKRFEGVIVDESTILKSYKGGRAMKGGAFGKALMGVARWAKWRVVMSGTPAPNGAEDLWGQFHFLDPDGNLLEASWPDFRTQYMQQIFFGSKSAAVENVDTDDDGDESDDGGKKKVRPCKWFTPKAKADEVGKIIAPLTFRARIRDHLHDLPPRTDLVRKEEMGPKQSKHYAEMKKSLATIIDDERIAVNVKLAQIAKLRTITGGFLLDEQEKPHAVEDGPKFEMLDGIVNDEIAQENKIVIFGQYRFEISEMEKRYKGCVSVYGDNSAATNMANIRQFKEDPDTRIIILHPASCAHGITLTEAHYCIFYSLSFSAEQVYQAVARIERASQKHPMFVFHLILNGSIDETLYSVVHQKFGRQAELIDQALVEQELVRSIR